MNVKVENTEKNTVKLTIEVDSAAFEEAMEKSYKKNVKHITLPGFRKGKAPRRFVEKYYGEAVFYEDAINFVCPEAYDKAIEENKIEAVAQPEIDIEQIGGGQNLIFTAVVTVKPEVNLGEYKGVKVDKIEYAVTEEDIDKEIEMEWSRIPHFYRRFYVYQYATGFSAAMALSKRILDSGEKAVKDYLAFLSGGCSTDPVSLLKIAGVDMSTPQPVNDALELFAHLIDELEELLV